MSFDFNYKFWLLTKKDIKELIKRQNLLKKKEPIEDPIIQFRILSQIYILYAKLIDKLGYLYRETIQVQKKDVIRSLIEPAIKRFIELKNRLREMELSEFVYLDKFLIEQKLTPYDLFIWGSSFKYNRPLEIKDVVLEPHRNSTKSLDEVLNAIIKLQSHERARKARLLKCAFDDNKYSLENHIDKKVSYSFTTKKDLLVLIPIKRTIFRSNFVKSTIMSPKDMDEGNIKEIKTNGDHDIAEKLIDSALIIQKAWKNYKAHKLLKMKLDAKQLLYGMRKKKKLLKPEECERNNIETHQKHLKQKQLYKDYDQLINDERERLLKEHKPQIMEDISDHIRDWFREFYEKTGDFHPYPDVNQSGTISLLVDETMNMEEFKEYQQNETLSKEKKKIFKEKNNLLKQQEKEKNKKEKLKEIRRQRKMRISGIYDIGNELKRNKNVEKIEKTISKIATDWKNVDEYLNKQYDVIKEWVTESQLAIIHRELRTLVDKYMRIEYDLLKQSWCADKKVKFKSTITREKEILNKNNMKTTNDLSRDRKIASLYEELRRAEIIDKYPLKAFEDYIGDFNVMADGLRNDDNHTTLDPGKADIKLAIQDILFGMGAFNVEKSKTLCLVGPENNGKKLLCNIIASELGALFINLSPEKTFRFAENLKHFVNVVMKVAKACQPTIIFIEEVHRIFWEKIPKDQIDVQPTLLKNALAKNILKSIGNRDKIMVLGTSSLPWNANKKFNKVFPNILMIPESDYGTIFLMWLELLTQNINRNYFEESILSVLAKLFQKYNTGDIANNVISTLNIERRLRLHANPLSPNEFLDYFLLNSNPLFAPNEKVSEKYKQWYNKSNKYEKMKLSKTSKKIRKRD